MLNMSLVRHSVTNSVTDKTGEKFLYLLINQSFIHSFNQSINQSIAFNHTVSIAHGYKKFKKTQA